jgi:two-component system LytT family sensor kinase
LPTSNIYNFPITKPWVYHSLFWVSYYIFAALISLSINQIYDARFYWQLLTLLPPDMLLVYTNLYLLMPYLLLRKRLIGYIIALLLTITLTSLLNIALHRVYTSMGSPFFVHASDFDGRNFAGHVLNSIYLLGLATAVKFGKDWMAQRQQLQEKDRQQVATELNFLKAQIHPHFFFNTLNNLYSLTLQKSDLAPEVVLKLSDLMSYMLYESAAPLVPLDKEISNLENYIALERLRFGGRLCLSFEKEGLEPIPPPGQGEPAVPVRIPPLLLLTFVENSFKHGMNQTIGEGRIDISLVVHPDDLIFNIDNPVGSEAATQEKNGIGLTNVIRRLDLLYGSRYRLDLSGTDNRFHVTLKIPRT